MTRVIDSVFILSIALANQVSSTNNGKNGRQYYTLCAIYREATAPIGQKAQPFVQGADYDTLLEANMSVSDENWQKMFDDDSETNTWAKKKDGLKAKNDKIDWEKEWESWRKARKALIKEAGKWATLSKDLKKPAATSAAAQRIRELTRAEQAAVRQAASEPTVGPTKITDAIQTKLKDALCAGKAAWKNSPATCDMTNPAESKSTACDKTHAGKSLLSDMLCLCATVTNGECLQGAASNSLLNVAALKSGAMAELLEHCPKIDDNTPPAQQLANGLSAFQSMVGQGKNVDGAIIFGGDITTGCDNPASSCVDYQEQFKKDGKGFGGIDWLVKMRQALSMQTIYEQHLENQKNTAELLKRAPIEALELYKERQQQPLTLVPPAPTHQKPSQAATNCGEHTANATCTDNNCKWDSAAETTGKHCKPQNGKEQKTQGTDRSAGKNAEGKKCTDKKRKEDCKDCCKCEGK
uniref:Variant surface glycoprotein 1169 n=1 Tax=Trypanosoma brucei TaxID=5691 RepID=M4SUR5_9TRYP|nr:variant surface glycoprotein 1169 [Trypanosoma brucei]